MTDPRIYTEADWRVLDSLKVRNLTALKGITEQVNAQIIRELSDGINAGESIPKLSKRLQESVNFGKQRATTMARTETINACADGARVRYEQYGVKEFQYIAASDSRTCQQCAELDGKVFKLTDNAHMPPLHPNCRCCIAAVIPKRDGTSKPTSGQKPNESLVSFTDRADLTREEKHALRYYQDIGNPQHNWDVDIPKDETHRDCYVINNALRSIEFRDNLSKHDRDILDTLVAMIDSAILKSVVSKETRVVRGLTNPEFMQKYRVGSIYDDDAYGSYSLSASVAQRYAQQNDSDPVVFIVRTIYPGQRAIHVGGDEQEFLVARGRQYLVSDIITYTKGELIDDHEAIVYYLSEV